MNNQDFKALLEALNRIEEAIKIKQGDNIVETVNRFSTVLVALKTLHKALVEVNEEKIAELVSDIIKIYLKIATDILNENNQSSK